MGTVSWTRGGSPLALFAEGFCQELARRGHPATTVKHHITLMGQLSCWLGAQGLSPSELNKARAEEFLAAATGPRPTAGADACEPGGAARPLGGPASPRA